MMEHLTMFIVVRKDLIKSLNWPLGAVMAQSCHACTAAVWSFRDEDRMKEYMNDMSNMHKVTLEIKNLSQIESLAKNLTEANIKHVVWTEQPENQITAIATLPCKRSEVGDLFKKCQLFK